ncbi:aminoglycoside phosphotransferase family protein [Pontibacillus salicampi]|uniref:Aminoglycoside phosphotransferase family protein n=1 Tax=Pontibacillus salicampi TaxID=1449801 RepID=A0ABV6LMX6_9BACI
MNSLGLKQISYIRNADSIIELNKGFSHDKKYVIDNTYLLRIFPIEDMKSRQKEFNTLNNLSMYSDYVPRGIEFGALKDTSESYMILSYLPGVDAEVSLNSLTYIEQYSSGFKAGKELKKLHKLSAPSGYPSWYTVKKQKSDKYLLDLKKINVDDEMRMMLENYIRDNEALMKNRPNKFQHDDFHPSNILINKNQFSGINDFQRMDWGDPIHDLQKLGFFSKPVSIEFTKGIIDGYHNGKEISNLFWELFTFYSAVHIVSALVWGNKTGQEQYNLLHKYSLDVISDHDNFQSVIPEWYRNSTHYLKKS